jgi:hypothetical protein
MERDFGKRIAKNLDSSTFLTNSSKLVHDFFVFVVWDSREEKIVLLNS